MSRRRPHPDRRPPAVARQGDRAQHPDASPPVAADELALVPPPHNRAVSAACCLAVAVATTLAFAPAADNEFTYWDDNTNYMAGSNPHIRHINSDTLRWMLTTNLLGVWQPLTWFLTAVEFQLLGRPDDAAFSRGMHRVSIGLHAAAAALLFFVARRLLALALPRVARDDRLALDLGALAAALAFGLHPLRTELIAWASGQPYIFAILPALGCIWAYLRACETGRRRWHVLAVSLLVCATLCKASVVPLVAVLAVLDVYPLRRIGGPRGWSFGQLKTLILEKAVHALPALLVVCGTIWATTSNRRYNPDPWLEKYLVASYCLLFYVSVTFVPYRLAPYYMKPTPFDTGDPAFVTAGILFMLVTFAAVLVARRRPWVAAVWAAHVLILLPAVGIVQHGGQMAADRYTYVPGLVWAVLLGGGFATAWARWQMNTAARLALALLAVAAAAGLAGRSREYCGTWKDNYTMWTAMIERNPRYFMGYYNRAMDRKRRGDVTGAISDYEAALRLYAHYPEANVNLGNIYKQSRRYDLALRHYDLATRGRKNFHMALMNKAEVLTKLKRYAEAADALRRAEAEARESGAVDKLPAIQSMRRKAEQLLRNPRDD